MASVGGAEGHELAYHIHQNVGQHAHAHLVVAPGLLQAFEELLARDTTLVGGCAAQALCVRQHVGGEQGLDGAANLVAQPFVLELAHADVELLALLLQHDAVGMAVELFVGEAGGVLGVDLAEGRRNGAPRVLKVDLVAVEALAAERHVSWRCVVLCGVVEVEVEMEMEMEVEVEVQGGGGGVRG
jgi:hypothetical protein